MSDQSIKLGLALGLTTMGRWRGGPVAYLYNGVRLPKLPKIVGLDAPLYEYQLIEEEGDTSDRWYQLMSTTYPCFNSDGQMDMPNGSNSEKWGTSEYVPEEVDSGWIGGTSGLVGDSFYESNTAKDIPSSRVIWANYDILNEDGSVFLKASTPIPIYE